MSGFVNSHFYLHGFCQTLKVGIEFVLSDFKSFYRRRYLAYDVYEIVYELH